MTKKRYKQALEVFDKTKEYVVDDAMGLVKKTATAKFDETVELAVKLKMKKGQSFRDTMVLPHQFGGEKRILVFARGEKAAEAEKVGATYVGDTEYIEKVKGGWFDFDVVIATPDMMKDIGKLGPVLGRRGLMPTPKTKTITTDIANTVNELKKGRVEIRADKTGVVHVPIGKASMGSEELASNANAVIHEIAVRKPSDTKGDFILSIATSSTMGPGIRIAAPLK